MFQVVRLYGGNAEEYAVVATVKTHAEASRLAQQCADRLSLARRHFYKNDIDMARAVMEATDEGGADEVPFIEGYGVYRVR